MKNVVIVCDGAGLTGGTERVAITSALALQARGQNVAYFAGEPIDTDELDNIETHSLGLTDAYNSSKKEILKRFVWNEAAGTAFGAFLQKFDPQDTIVHFHAFRRTLSGAVVLEAKRRGFKTVFTVHDFGVACPNTTFFVAPKTEICTRKPLSVSCYACQCTHKGWPMKLMQMARGRRLANERINEAFDHFVYVSEFSRNIMAPHLPPQTPATTLYNPVSANQSPLNNQREPVFLYVGRLSQEKGVVGFARAAKAAGVTCRFIGDGPERAAILEANPNAECVGWLPHAEVQKEIQDARAVVMPSLWYETAGLAVIEAISQGTPAIVSRQCASTEYVSDKETGILYSGERELTAVLAAMTAEAASALGEAAYTRYWEDPLSIESHIDGLLKVYEQTLSS